MTLTRRSLPRHPRHLRSGGSLIWPTTTGGPPVSICENDPGRDQGFPTNRRPHVDEILRRLGALWQAPALTNIPVELNPRFSRTLGRLAVSPWRIELGPRALVREKRLREVVTHEGAHAVLAMKAGPSPRHPTDPNGES